MSFRISVMWQWNNNVSIDKIASWEQLNKGKQHNIVRVVIYWQNKKKTLLRLQRLIPTFHRSKILKVWWTCNKTLKTYMQKVAIFYSSVNLHLVTCDVFFGEHYHRKHVNLQAFWYTCIFFCTHSVTFRLPCRFGQNSVIQVRWRGLVELTVHRLAFPGKKYRKI